MPDIRPFSSQPTYDVLGAWGAWNLMVEAHNTLQFHLPRMATPGRDIPVDVAQESVADVQHRWQAEADIRDKMGKYTGAPKLTQLPVAAQLWLHECLEIERGRIAAASPLPDWYPVY